MNSISNYIKNGQGYGMKVLFIFSVVFAVVIGVLSYYVAGSYLKSPAVAAFVNDIPALQVKDERLIEPQNEYVVLSVPGFEKVFFVINTMPNNLDVMSFDNAIYLTQDRMYTKIGKDIQISAYEKDNIYITPTIIQQAIDMTITVFPVVLGALALFFVWLGYLFLYLMSRVFTWLMGRALCPKMRSRIIVLSWAGVLMLDVVFSAVGYPFPFMADLLLAFLVICIALMLAPTHSDDVETALEGLSHSPAKPVAVAPRVKKKPIKKTKKMTRKKK